MSDAAKPKRKECPLCFCDIDYDAGRCSNSICSYEVPAPPPIDRAAKRRAATRARAMAAVGVSAAQEADDLEAFCAAFHQKNPWLYMRFKEMALAERGLGRARYGAKTIMERLRWEAPEYTRDDSFKLPNTAKDRLSARYARMLIAEIPEFSTFFEIRRLSTPERRAALSDAHKQAGR